MQITLLKYLLTRAFLDIDRITERGLESGRVGRHAAELQYSLPQALHDIPE